MLRVYTTKDKEQVLKLISPHCISNFPLNFDIDTETGYEEFDDRIYIDGQVTFDDMAKVVDYVRSIQHAKK